MFTTPCVDEIIDLAASMGVHLNVEEAIICQGVLGKKLLATDEFLQSRVPEDRPELLFPQRAPGYQPLRSEDPFNAWLWKCDIGGEGYGLLAGKTVSFKDHVPVAGMPITYGARAFERLIADFDATVVTRVLAHGGRVTGKNVMNGPFGGTMSGDDVTRGDFWRPLNPHNPEHVTSGSSSGSAVAVAAGEVDISFGGDQGGSVRIPAAFCGVVGLKPSFGLVPHTGITFGSDPSVDHVGPIARNVQDVAAALEAVAGYDDLDPCQSRHVPERMDVLSSLDGGITGLRVGILDEGFDDPIDEEVRSGVLRALDVLVKAGAEVQPISVPEHRIAGMASSALNSEGARGLYDSTAFAIGAKTYYPTSLMVAWSIFYASSADLIQPRKLFNLLLGEFSRREFHGAAYAKAHNVRPHFVRSYDAALKTVDILAMPTCRSVAPKVVEPPLDHIEERMNNFRQANYGSPATYNTQPFSYTGHPAVAVPCGKIDGLPYSLQLVGRLFDDSSLLRAVYAYQKSVDWDELMALGQ